MQTVGMLGLAGHRPSWRTVNGRFSEMAWLEYKVENHVQQDLDTRTLIGAARKWRKDRHTDRKARILWESAHSDGRHLLLLPNAAHLVGTAWGGGLS